MHRRTARAAALLAVLLGSAPLCAQTGAAARSAERGVLGIELVADTATAGGAPHYLVRDLRPGSPAEGTGLAPGDTLVSVAGRIARGVPLTELVGGIRAGDEVAVAVRRGGRELVVRMVAEAAAANRRVFLRPDGTAVAVDSTSRVRYGYVPLDTIRTTGRRP